eukprot:CAMPEP_0197726470 /NCGR_PEP_ID=MMETSP1434-20131217/16063_1 /TAXON_ID=265543 /ORGANISM="Minutocellus polymorphus, Strain CCMP3303" /LENGTH=421 /DNA_ID=CAMNT_0043312415 /DNA_START=121 /DNA_END=1386 /DNA_ORIENTATION=+
MHKMKNHLFRRGFVSHLIFSILFLGSKIRLFIPETTPKGLYRHPPRYAYAWVLGGIHEDKPSYKGFVWTILISADILRREGSEADFWVFARMSPNSTLYDLPKEDRRLFRALDINVVLLDKPKKESFAQIVFDKFLTINMTDYKRVLFLDGDMVPMTNLDFYFHLSDPHNQNVPTLLKPNFIIATRGEPCNTGMFMVEPSKQNFEKYLDIVRRQHQKAKTLPHPHFDWGNGWGHSFTKTGDFWESVKITKRQQWRWHASHSDQGLMYMYAKYVIQNVSIAIGERIQNWREGPKNLPEKESDVRDILTPFQGKLLRHQHSCSEVVRGQQNRFWRCNPPYDSTAHFMGKKKPWLGEHIKDEKATHGLYGAKGQWFAELKTINDKLNMSIEVERWNSHIAPQMNGVMLGEMAMFRDQDDLIGIV